MLGGKRGRSGSLDVDADDYLVWRQNFGNFVIMSSAASLENRLSVPEPESLRLLAAGLGILTFWSIHNRIAGRGTPTHQSK